MSFGLREISTIKGEADGNFADCIDRLRTRCRSNKRQSAGLDLHLVKPIQPDEVTAQINQLVLLKNQMHERV